MTFRVIPSHELGPAEFEEHPVWSVHSDAREIEEIVSWGVDREELRQQLQPTLICSEEFVYPVLQLDELPARQSLLLRASFLTPSGRRLGGYLVNHPPQCIGLFVDGEAFLFNRNLPELARESLESMQRCLGERDEGVFPLAYETIVRPLAGNPLRGTFDLSED